MIDVVVDLRGTVYDILRHDTKEFTETFYHIPLKTKPILPLISIALSYLLVDEPQKKILLLRHYYHPG